MTVATGIFKRLAYKRETTWNVAAGAASAQVLRRVTSDIDVDKDNYQSNEVVQHQQIIDFRTGMSRVTGRINGEISAGTYKEFMAGILRRDFTSVSAMTGLSLTIASIGGTPVAYTVTRSAGSYLTDGVKVGMIVRITAGSVNANNLNKNLFVTAIGSATVITVIPQGTGGLTAEGPIASCTVSVPGKITYTPQTGHINPSFSIEHYYSDLVLSELYTGCRIGTMNMNMPPTGMSTVEFSVLGGGVTTDVAAYFTTPTSATTTGVSSAVNGIAMVGGAVVGNLTGLTVNVNGDPSVEQVVGSRNPADVYVGRVVVTGQMTAAFQNTTLRDAFLNETETSIACVFNEDGTNDAETLCYAMHRVKLGGARRNDNPKNLTITLPYQALLNGAGGAGTSTEATTLWIQDSAA